MIIYVDIDDTICYYKDGDNKQDYHNAIPYKDRIIKINTLYDWYSLQLQTIYR